MTVGELIRALKKYPHDMQIGYSDVNYTDESFKIERLNNVRRLFVYNPIASVMPIPRQLKETTK